jgi:hypothetical protein
MDNEKKNLLGFPRRIFVLWALFFVFCAPAFAADATLYVSPITGTYTIGATIPLRIMVSSAGDPVNAVEGKLTYDPKEIEVIDASKDGSVLSSWTIAPVYDNEAGTLSFGGLLATSTVLDRGLVVAFTVRAKRSGDVRMHFATGAAVHAADGTGGNLLSTLNGGIYAITPKEGVLASTSMPIFDEEDPVVSLESDEHLATSSDEVSGEVLGVATGTPITSTTHPDQALWYALATSTINWEIPEGLARVRLALDKKPVGEGVVPYEVPKHEKILTNLDDGVWYVHLTREFIDGHTDTNAYRLNIDTTPPLNVTVSEKPRDSSTNPNVIFLMSATDTSSGIEHYVFVLDDETAVSWVDDGTHAYHTQALKVGTHKLVVSTVDRAGNKSDEVQVQFSVEYLETPALASDTKQFTEGDHLTLSLSAVPNAVVGINIEGGGQTANEEFTVDANGRGQFTSKLILSPGAYEVWGIARNAQGALSRDSERMHIEVSPSFIGIVKRHPFIPVAVVAFFVFLFFMRAVLRRLRSGEGVFGVNDDIEDDEDDNEEVPHSPPIARSVSSGAVVLGAFKERPKDRQGRITITR